MAFTKVIGAGIKTTTDARVGILTAERFDGPFTDLTVTNNLTVGGVLTYEDVTDVDSIGIITARDYIHVGAGISIVGVATAATFKGDGDFVELDVDGHTELDNVNIVGVTTISNAGGTKLYEGSGNGSKLFHAGTERLSTEVYGIDINGELQCDTLDVDGNGDISGNLVVGAAGTTITTTVGAAASVGIGTANPAYMLDVAGAINSSNDVKINGTSVLTSALNEAVAMAIALG